MTHLIHHYLAYDSLCITDHLDPGFISERKLKLDLFIKSLVAIPHVCNMICVKAFFGLMDQVKEFSISFPSPTLGRISSCYLNIHC